MTDDFCLYGTALPPRPNSSRRKPASRPHSIGSAPVTSVPNAIGRRMDALGISSSRLACLLSCRHSIPVRAETLRSWVIVEFDVPTERDRVAEAIAVELGRKGATTRS